MHFLNFQPRFIAFIVVSVFCFTGCKQKKVVLKSPPHYNFQEVFTDKLDLKIKEISGLDWDGVNNVFVAHNDESGKLFLLDRDSKAIKEEFSFGGKGDYEDIALVKQVAYVLKSDGVITRVSRDSAQVMKGVEVGKLTLEGSVDFETMYYDSARHALVLICKNCKVDDNSGVSAYAFYIDSVGFDNKPLYTIDAAKIEELSPKKTSKFQPSGARINPKLKKLFIISSAANQLVVADLDGKVESVHWLTPKLFKQPEGITFNRSGDMYISNEGVTSQGTIHRFVYKP